MILAYRCCPADLSAGDALLYKGNQISTNETKK